MTEQESNFKSFEEAKAAFEMQLKTEVFDLEKIQSLVEDCIGLLSTQGENEKEKDLLIAQRTNLLRDFQKAAPLELANFRITQPENKTKVEAEIKERLSNYVNRLTKFRSRQKQLLAACLLVGRFLNLSYNTFTIMKEVIVSGIRASGKLHVGNYLGALKQFVELQETNARNCFFFIADLHALTTPFEPEELSQNTLEVAAEYLAAGIDPAKSTFFLQSQVLEHAELGWIFNCLTTLGELYRMTQFKEKSGSPESMFEGVDALDHKAMTATVQRYQKNPNINAGLLTYPTLMAADILLYKPTAVPVGDDQTQHVELTRDIARKFNNRFGQTFPEPKTFERKPLRIMSLTDPSKKMSKTGDEALMLDDSPEEILRKLKKAVTATDTKQGSPGVDNLKLLLEHFSTTKQVKDFSKYDELKQVLAKAIGEYFADFRGKKATLMKDQKQISEILIEGAKKAQTIANQTLGEVKEKIGLI